MNEFIEDNKKKIVIIAIIILATIAIGIVNMFMNGKSAKVTPESALKELGAAYYEEIYYPYLMKNYPKNNQILLERYSKDGKKVTLLTLLTSVENANASAFSDEKNDKSCDMTLTYIKIIPKAPYGEKDYTIETTLRCDIEISSEGHTTNESGE